MKDSGNAGDLVAGDLPAIPGPSGVFDLVKRRAPAEARQTTKTDRPSYLLVTRCRSAASLVMHTVRHLAYD